MSACWTATAASNPYSSRARWRRLSELHPSAGSFPHSGARYAILSEDRERRVSHQLPGRRSGAPPVWPAARLLPDSSTHREVIIRPHPREVRRGVRGSRPRSVTTHGASARPDHRSCH
jgi:hypothetical protein